MGSFFVAKSRDGAWLAACSPDCIADLIVGFPSEKLHADKFKKVVRRFEAPVCLLCRGCGYLIAKPEDCQLHGGRCPGYNWLYSVQAKHFARCYLFETKTVWIPDDVWDEACEVAAEHDELNGVGVAEKVLGLR
jgi:hypothetical protein